MEILVEIKGLLQLVGLQDSTNAKHQLWNYIKRIYCFASVLYLLIPIFWFTLFEAKTFEEQVISVLGIVCGVTNFAIYCAIFLNRNGIYKMFDKLQAKVQER